MPDEIQGQILIKILELKYTISIKPIHDNTIDTETHISATIQDPYPPIKRPKKQVIKKPTSGNTINVRYILIYLKFSTDGNTNKVLKVYLLQNKALLWTTHAIFKSKLDGFTQAKLKKIIFILLESK